MLYLHQIGDVGINWNWSNFRTQSPLWFAGSVSGKGRSVQMLASNSIRYVSREFVYSEQTADIEGILFSGKDEHVTALIGRLNRLVDMDVPIISYLVAGEDHIEKTCNCVSMCTHGFVWLVTQGQLRSARLVHRGEGQNPSIRLTVSYNPLWSPLDRYQWEWDTVTPYLLHAEHPSDYDDGYPFTPEISDLQSYGDCCSPTWNRKLFSAQDRLHFYYPEYWVSKPYNVGAVRLLDAREHTGSETYSVYSNNDIWSGSPLSMWGFHELPTSGQVRVKVTRISQVFSEVDDYASLDLGEIDSDLDHDGGLTSDDLLIVGETPYGQAFLIRRESGQPPRILTREDGCVYNPTVYGVNLGSGSSLTYAPCMLSSGVSNLDVTVSDPTIEWGSLHVFRRI